MLLSFLISNTSSYPFWLYNLHKKWYYSGIFGLEELTFYWKKTQEFTYLCKIIYIYIYIYIYISKKIEMNLITYEYKYIKHEKEDEFIYNWILCICLML